METTMQTSFQPRRPRPVRDKSGGDRGIATNPFIRCWVFSYRVRRAVVDGSGPTAIRRNDVGRLSAGIRFRPVMGGLAGHRGLVRFPSNQQHSRRLRLPGFHMIGNVVVLLLACSTLSSQQRCLDLRRSLRTEPVGTDGSSCCFSRDGGGKHGFSYRVGVMN